MSFHVWEGEGGRNRKRGEDGKERGGEGGSRRKVQGRGKVRRRQSHCNFFSFSPCPFWKKPQENKRQGGESKKSSTLDYNCCFHPDVGAPVPWTPLCVCLRINVDLNYWISHQHKVWLFVDFTGVCGEVVLASAAPTPTFCFYLLFIVSAAGLNVWHRRGASL